MLGQSRTHLDSHGFSSLLVRCTEHGAEAATTKLVTQAEAILEVCWEAQFTVNITGCLLLR